MINRIQAAADCLAAAKLLYKRHLVNAYEGNVSIRLPHSHGNGSGGLHHNALHDGLAANGTFFHG